MKKIIALFFIFILIGVGFFLRASKMNQEHAAGSSAIISICQLSELASSIKDEFDRGVKDVDLLATARSSNKRIEEQCASSPLEIRNNKILNRSKNVIRYRVEGSFVSLCALNNNLSSQTQSDWSNLTVFSNGDIQKLDKCPF